MCGMSQQTAEFAARTICMEYIPVKCLDVGWLKTTQEAFKFEWDTVALSPHRLTDVCLT